MIKFGYVDITTDNYAQGSLIVNESFTILNLFPCSGTYGCMFYRSNINVTNILNFRLYYVGSSTTPTWACNVSCRIGFYYI